MTPLYHRRPNGRYALAGYDLSTVFPPGYTLVHVEPVMRSTMHHIDPDRAALLAAIHAHRDEVIAAVHEAMAARPRGILTPAQARAWEALQATGVVLETEGAATVVERLVGALER